MKSLFGSAPLAKPAEVTPPFPAKKVVPLGKKKIKGKKKKKGLPPFLMKKKKSPTGGTQMESFGAGDGGAPPDQGF